MENENIVPVIEEPVIEKPIVPQVPQEPEKRINFFKILIVLIGILISLGLFLNAYLMFSKKETATKTSDISVIPTPTPEPTADWKTYENIKAGISFKYPGDWEISFGESNHMGIILKKIDQLQEKVDLPGDIKQFPEYSIVINLPPNESMKIPETNEKVIVGGIQGTKFSQGAAPSSGPSTLVTVEKDNSTYLFSYNAMAHQETHTKYLNIFDQILSTFKFTDSSSSIDTTNWKTYTNTQYKYSLKYPADYYVIETSPDYVRFFPGINDPNLPQSQTYLSIQLDKSSQQLPEAVYKTTADGKTLRISQVLMGVEENQKPQIKAIFDQILSTFRFD